MDTTNDKKNLKNIAFQDKNNERQRERGQEIKKESREKEL